MRKFVLSVFTMLLMCFQLTAQDQHVTGIVTDAASGEPIIGAVVAVKGTQNAFVTGIDGDYMIDVPANGTLEFTYVGYKTQEIVVNPGQTVINVTMAQESENIEQVVVIGYGSARSVGSVTGAVSVVNSEILNDKPVMNVADALSGQVSGMSVMTSSGEPSASSSIRIHGSGSISAGTEPLYVIDGMPSSANQFLALSSNDIENMVTLKDASATSIYGSRAANGVIYITTKKGSRTAQKAQFRLSGGYGISTPVNNNLQQMSGRDLLDWQLYFNEISRTSYDSYLANMEMFGGTDWFKYVYQPAPTYNGEFSVSGGSENISYYVSGSYMNQDGIAPGSSMERYTFRTNLAAEATSWMRINMNMAISTDKRISTQDSVSSTQGVILSAPNNFATYMPSYMSRKYLTESGEVATYTYFPNGMMDPWYAMKEQPQGGYNTLYNGNISIVLTPLKGLTITSLNGIDGAFSTMKMSGLPSYELSGGSGVRGRNYNQYRSLTTSNTIEYKLKPIKDFHNLTFLVGQEGIDYQDDFFAVMTTGQADDRLMLLSNGTNVIIGNVSESNSSYNMLSFFGRVNYDYKNKYSLDVTVRNDASSKFGADNRDAFFYAVGGMWNISQEKFLMNNRVLTDLKLRATYGTQGNSSISYYTHLALIAGGMNYAGNAGRYFANPGNSHLGWEKQGMFNVSLELGLWHWLTASINYYDRRSTDMLFDVPYPPSSGVTSHAENALGMLNRGVDVDIAATIFQNKDWNIGVSTTFGYNSNKITYLYSTDAITLPDQFAQYKVGRSAWSFYLPEFMGVDPRDGKPMFNDGNGNPVKDANLAAYINTGKEYIAPYYGGFNIDVRWKGLSLQANFTYQLDKWLYNGDRFFTESTTTMSQFQRPENMKNIWTEPGDITDIPAYGETMIHSTAYLENASFLRLKNLTLSYQFPSSLLKKTGFIQGIKVSAIFRNLWTLTKYTGYDPEYDGKSVYGMYPNTRQYSFSLEFMF